MSQKPTFPKVWVVTFSDPYYYSSDNTFDKVFSSRDKADEYAKIEKTQFSHLEFKVEEIEVE